MMECFSTVSQIPLEEISNWTFKFQKTWEGGQKRWHSFGFQLIPPEEENDSNVPKSNLYKAIRYGGGTIYSGCSDPEIEEPVPYVIRVLNEEYFAHNEAEDCIIPPDTYSSAFIFKCIGNKKKNLPYPDSRKYIIPKATSWYVPYDALKILRREMNWSDLHKRPRVCLPATFTARKWITELQKQKAKLDETNEGNLNQQQGSPVPDNEEVEQGQLREVKTLINKKQLLASSGTHCKAVVTNAVKRKSPTLAPGTLPKRAKVGEKIAIKSVQNSGYDKENTFNIDSDCSDQSSREDSSRRVLSDIQSGPGTSRYRMRSRLKPDRRITRSVLRTNIKAKPVIGDSENCNGTSTQLESKSNTQEVSNSLDSTNTTLRSTKASDLYSDSDSYDSDQDASEYSEAKSSNGIQQEVVQSPKTPVRGQKYSVREGQLILDVICDHNAFYFVRGIKFWKIFEESKLLKGRTHQSLKSHFIHTILPQVKKRETYEISDFDLQKLNDILNSTSGKHATICPDLAL
ncbi:unnamed protein product [Orchesella dallaii]|uniref:Uncharacterized protein n=1 Tax=Orchesella dallaii TaxID=48710 RepID=A0ABP1QA54_9HEXA